MAHLTHCGIVHFWLTKAYGSQFSPKPCRKNGPRHWNHPHYHRGRLSQLVAGRERQLVRARDLLCEGPCLIAVLELLDEIQKLAGLIAVQT